VGWFALDDLPPINDLNHRRIAWAVAGGIGSWFSAPTVQPR
jgi:hypothetical protein